jgi:hypothetical protein
MHIELFRDSQDSYLRALQEFQVTAIQRQPRPGLIVNSGFRFFVEKAVELAGPISEATVKWLNARGSRKVIVTRKDGSITHIEGYSAAELAQLFPLIERLTVIDTKPADQAAPIQNDAVPPPQ